MYSFLKVRNLGNAKILTKPVDILVQKTCYLCSFCKFYHQQIFNASLTCRQLKQYSTTVKPSEIDIRFPKKIKRNNGKFLEILEVTDAAAKNRRTKVKKLNAKNLSEFVETNNVTDNKIKTPSIVENEILPKKKSKQKKNELIEELKIFHNREKDEETNGNSVKEERTENQKMKTNQQASKIDDDKADRKFLRNKNLMRVENALEIKKENLLSFFQVCLNGGKQKQAFNCFLRLADNAESQMSTNFENIKLHNLFLSDMASRGDLKNVILLKDLMKKHSIALTPESYAYIFECVARTSKPSKHIEFLKSVQDEMHENQISFNQVITRPMFIKDQFEKVMQIVKLLDENFVPYFRKRRNNYHCHLLNNIFVNQRYESPAKGLFQLSDLRERARKQFEIESVGEVQIKSIAPKSAPTEKAFQAQKLLSEIHEMWRVEIRKGFNRNLKILQARKTILRTTDLHPYLSVLDPEDYVDEIIKEAKNLTESTELFSPPIHYLSRDLAFKLFKKYEYKVQQKEGLLDNILKCYDDYCEWYLEGGRPANGRNKWLSLEHELKQQGITSHYPVTQWSPQVMKELGLFLYDIILKDLKFKITSKNGNEILVPAFYIVFRSKYKQVKEEIKPHPLLTKMYHDCQSETLSFSYDLLPSLSPPKPWSSIDKGGYLVSKTVLVRVPYGFTDQVRRMWSLPREQMYPSLDCLNQLGTIPWRVNNAILDVATKVFQNGGSEQLNVPEPPSVLPEAPVASAESTYEERCKIAKTAANLKKKKNEMFSLWCDALYKLSLANHYKDEIFWLPHNMDFRGRVYPIPPHLSHIGSDFSRSLLIFAQEKPLGPKGLDWLKIHIINLTGFKKKESIQSRLEYANEILDKILDSAENPLTGKMWWTSSDEPWQTLAACMEISKALKSPNPSEYSTGFPIHQDGSCNGLQHYAALGRDQFGAESVNLYPFEKPRDIYSDVVVRVEEARRLDAENNMEIAKILEGHIQRKVIKQTIMTTVYGVTRYGARLQIRKQLEDLENFPENKVMAASSYLVEQTFRSLRTMFTSAREIQDWFTECAKLICTLRGASVEWETPLGLPVIQPYYKVDTQIRQIPNMTKQRNAFPPNFIHSLDSTHMMLTSLYCEQAGITFMSVHDCFWTHPSTVSKMNQICRKQFISLHSEPILENLSQHLLNKFKFSEEEINNCVNVKVAESCENLNKVLAQIPAKGTYDLKNIEFSTYFFS